VEDLRVERNKSDHSAKTRLLSRLWRILKPFLIKPRTLGLGGGERVVRESILEHKMVEVLNNNFNGSSLG